MEALDPSSLVLLTAYYSTLAVLSFFGGHRFWLLFAGHPARRRDADSPLREPAEKANEAWPFVTVQLPIYNERFVARRLLDAVSRLDYPPGRLEIQVLDDSTDDTTEIVGHCVHQLRETGLAIEHVRRGTRAGFKAGALEYGLQSARGSLIAIFDADFLPQADFLRRTVPELRDPRVGMVQARWDHLNREASALTRAQAILLDGHFLVEQRGRHAAGHFFNFNGTAGVWRREAIDQSGGWEHDTLTEDLDLSYRAQLAGWQFRFLDQVAVPAELPARVDDFKTQQHRWTRGSIQTMRKLLGRIVRSRFPLGVRLEAFIHLTNNLSYPLLVLLSLLMYPSIEARSLRGATALLTLDLPLFFLATCSVALFYVQSQRLTGRRFGPAQWKDIPLAISLGVGLAPHNSAAALGGLLLRGGEFKRTAKFGVHSSKSAGGGASYRRPSSLSLVFEIFLFGYLLASLVAAARAGLWWSLPFLYLFAQGYGLVAWLGLRDHFRGATGGRLSANAGEAQPDLS